MNLADALRVNSNGRVALVGAGGKTTALFQLARALEPPVVVTNSVHLGTWQAGLADRHLIISRPEDVERFSGQVEGVTLMTGAPGEDDRLHGLDLDALDAIHDMANRLGFPVLVEADGSRRKPLKAPSEHEPVIPGWINAVVVVTGLAGLGQPLSDSVVHRAKRFAELCMIKTGDIISEYQIGRLLIHPQGGLKNIPAASHRAALLNQADEPGQVEAAFRIAKIVQHAYDSVLITSLSKQKIWRLFEPAAGIILAGGKSSRFGQPKMLLDWHGKPLVRHVAECAVWAGLDPVIVVTGAVDQPLREALSGLRVEFVYNPAWGIGQSTSVRAGVGKLAKNIGSAIFLLADQPLVPPKLLRKLIDRHELTQAAVVAPRVAGRRANPVLFDHRIFSRLLELEGDVGGRAILDQYPVEYVDWADDNLLLDIDTPEDYARLQGMDNL